MAAYRELYRRGELRERVETALSLLEGCSLCPPSCGANQLAGDVGKWLGEGCKVGKKS